MRKMPKCHHEIPKKNVQLFKIPFKKNDNDHSSSFDIFFNVYSRIRLKAIVENLIRYSVAKKENKFNKNIAFNCVAQDG